MPRSDGFFALVSRFFLSINVVVTDLINKAMPLIRYRLDDVAKWDTCGRCACGGVWPMVKEVGRRFDQRIALDNAECLEAEDLCTSLQGIIPSLFKLIQVGIRSFRLDLFDSRVTEEVVRKCQIVIEEYIGASINLDVVESHTRGELDTRKHVWFESANSSF